MEALLAAMPVASVCFSEDSSRKRKRLTFACNACRSRKVKCDDKQPTCTNCLKAGTECVTTDPRQPGQRVKRREAQLPEVIVGNPSGPVPQNNDSDRSSQEQNRFPAQLHDLPTTTPLTVPLVQHTNLHEVSRPPTPTSVANAPLPILPRFLSGNSLQVLTQWLDLAFLRIGVPPQFSSRHITDPLCRNPSTLLTLLASSQAAPLSALDIDNIATTYNSSINIIYPLFDPNAVMEILRSIVESSAHNGRDILSSTSAIAHLVIAIARCQDNDNDSSEALSHLHSAYALLSAIVAEASLRSAQALFLMALVLRGFNEVEVAWHLMVVAVSISHTLGMHRSIASRRRAKIGDASAEEHIRTWWAIYAFDKLLSLELERPSSIQDAECNQSEPKLNQSPPMFEGIIGLARVQSRISERCVLGRSSEEKLTMNYQDVIREKIQSQGELDQLLCRWEEGLANEIRPSNYLYCDSKLLPYVSFLAIQFYQTLVLLHRNTLLVNIHNARKEIDKYCVGRPYLHRLRNGQAICVNASRSILNVLGNIHEQSSDCILYSLNAPLIATYALAIQTLKHPTSRLVKSDFELLVQAILFVNQQRSLLQTNDTNLEELLSTLQLQVSAVIKEANSTNDAQTATPSTSTTNPPSLSNAQSGSQSYPPPVLNEIHRSTGSLDRTGMMQHPVDGNSFEPVVDATMGNDQFTLMDIPDLFDPASMLFDSMANTADMDWETLAAAFDLPSYDR